ncbi:ParB N-terminal domain-containing protein [Terrimonas sp. NA20]|uniref:ParB N-terminal domain-containing protein n=1 Tax=Terrimonas ginsenosidimutans TaxID=2908004 RepID=A0ABS9KKC8_9BACT|nr:ParB N-terminal domain-containing protein [Terrimonas ginsenosidimutans]MCG2612772.1 ParB N-terminal domain-containing protein [Terrimonas ginsenosidimutans]
MNADLLIESIEVEKLIFDPDNPRLPSSLKGYNKEKEILEWMLLNENVLELMGSIGEKGYFMAEPLLIVKSAKKRGFYEVVEGNRRLAAVKLLNTPALAVTKKNSVAEAAKDAKKRTKKIPSILFDTKDELLIYLGYRHITGIKEWDALAKAKYLNSLRISLKIRDKQEEFKTLAKIIGSSTSYVRNILSGLKVYSLIEKNNFFNIKGLNEVSVEFGVLYNATGRKNIAHFIGIDPDADDPSKSINVKKLEELTSWMFAKDDNNETRLVESRFLKDLDAVLSNNYATKAFRAGRPLHEAVLLTGVPAVIFAKSINKAIDNVKIARDQMSNFKPDATMLMVVDDIIKISQDLKTLIKAKIRE